MLIRVTNLNLYLLKNFNRKLYNKTWVKWNLHVNFKLKIELYTLFIFKQPKSYNYETAKETENYWRPKLEDAQKKLSENTEVIEISSSIRFSKSFIFT